VTTGRLRSPPSANSGDRGRDPPPRTGNPHGGGEHKLRGSTPVVAPQRCPSGRLGCKRRSCPGVRAADVEGVGSPPRHSPCHEFRHRREIARGAGSHAPGAARGRARATPHKRHQANDWLSGRSAGGQVGRAVPSRINIRLGVHARLGCSGAVWGGRMTARTHVPIRSRSSSGCRRCRWRRRACPG